MSVFVLALLVGCSTKAVLDEDGDGVAAADGDCDDVNAAVAPGLPEICDGLDNNCDGQTDEDPTDALTLYRDGDLDGYGDSSRPIMDCDPPEGYVEADGDCDDRLASTYPGAVERCDEADNNCDGQIDESGATGELTWYDDADGDGVGAEPAVTLACAGPEGSVEGSGDCDDSDASVYPGALELDCAVDRSCDGQIGVDLDADGYTDCSGDCDDADATVSPGAREICEDGLDNDCDGGSNDCALTGELPTSLAELKLQPGEGDALSGWLTPLSGRVTRLAIGGVDSDGEGIAWILDLPAPGTVSLADAATRIHGEPGALLGASVGDLSGDDVAELVLSQPDLEDLGVFDTGETSGDTSGDSLSMAGGLVALFGALPAGDQPLADAGAFIVGGTEGARFGAAVAAAGDADGDELPELWVGAPGGAGAVWLLASPMASEGLTQTSFAADLGSAAAGEADGDEAGAALASLGDLDGDGLPDLLVGAPGAEGGQGRIYVLSRDAAATTLADASASVLGEGDGFGRVLCAAGDVDGDGYDDALIGQPDRGEVALFYGPVTVSSVADADLVLEGEGSDGAGAALAAGDMDGDGRRDLWVSAPESASVLVFYGPVTGVADLIWRGDGAVEALSVSDLDLDGHDDLMLSETSAGGGQALILMGRGL